MIELFGIQFLWQAVLDIGLVALLYYNIILLLRGTRAVPVFYGLVVVVLSFWLSEKLNLFTLNTILGEFLGSIFLIVVILFQADIRRALAQVGAGRFFVRSGKVTESWLDELVFACMDMSKTRTGAIIVIEKQVPIGDIIERGVEIDARLSRQLITTIFQKDTPLHDGAVVVSKRRIAAASCILPLSSRLSGESHYGTRHRAALGISESTDAITAVVSEERGEVSIAIGGKLTTSLDEVRLRRVLRNALER